MGRRVTRKDKIESGEGLSESSKRTSEKFESSLGIKHIHLTEKQQQFYDVIDSNTITFCKAPAGVGKSLSALYYAVKNYLTNPGDKIIVVRTPVENNADKIGFLPDTLQAKLEPHFASARNLLEDLLTKGKVEADLDKRILFKIPNYMLGMTLDNAVVIIDEAQALQPLIMKLLLERIGKNTKVIVLGDPSQLYISDKNRNGLSDAIKRFFRENSEGKLTSKYENIGYFEFTKEDVIRSDIVKSVIEAYSDNPS